MSVKQVVKLSKVGLTIVTCGLTAKKPGSAPCPTLITEYETTLVYFTN